MTLRRKVLLTPLAFSNSDGQVVGVAIHDPFSGEVIEIVVSCQDLAERGKISLTTARCIFDAARAAADALSRQP